MKFMKKAAALFFCLALALSVMAITAAADDDAELLGWNNGVLEPDVNNEFTVMLTRSAESVAAVTNRDGKAGYEIAPTTDVTFDITVAYNHSSGFFDFTNKTIDGFQFDFIPANNYGATISAASVNIGTNNTPNWQSIAHAGNNLYSANSSNTYGYSPVGTASNDIKLPGNGTLTWNSANDTVTNGTKIAKITLSFEGATQAIDIYPQIENLRIHVREGGTDAAQLPVAASTPTYQNSAPNTNLYGDGTINGGKTPHNGGSTPTAPSAPATPNLVIVAPVPVIVNPVYTVKVLQFENNENTGILQKKTGDNDFDTYKYDFINGSFQTNSAYTDGNAGTVLPNTDLPGYTLQGWMVTDDTDGSNAWAKYAYGSLSPAWNENTSYPATTTAMAGKLTWKDTNDTWYNATGNTGRVEFNATYAYADDETSTQSNVNFIPVKADVTDNGNTFTKFPAGLTGNITLTPVYTRNVYTATFQSGNATYATFAVSNIKADANVSLPDGTANDATTVTSFTKLYTIEDLYDPTYWTEAYDASHVVDFLKLNDTDTETAPTGPWGAKRTAYKFMGWTVAATSTAPNSGYEWNRTADLVNTAAYNTIKILKTATCKHYNDVTFTAVWEEDIRYAEIGYQYAGDANTYALILVAVPSGNNANYDAKYTYQFTPSHANATAQNMFIVPKGTVTSDVESGQRAEYVSAAITLTTTSTSAEYNYHASEKFTDAIKSGDYVLFAYIGAYASVDQAKVTIDETTSSCGNETLVYDGNLDGDTVITVADFGNVDTLLRNDAATGVFSVEQSYGVRARLRADVTTDTEQGESGNLKFASIKDVKTIYNKMGYAT